MGSWFREWLRVGAVVALLGVENAREQWRSWKGRGVILCVLLVLPGLAACTPAMPVSGEAARPAMVEPPAGPWPRELTSGDNTFSIFQPQYERWEQGRLDGRSAVAVEGLASPEPRYGVVWFTARTQVDKETQLVTLEELTVSKTDFPTVPDGGAGYLAALQRAFSEAPLTIARDRLQAELEVEPVEIRPHSTVARIVAVGALVGFGLGQVVTDHIREEECRGLRGSPWAGPFESMPLDLSLGQALGAYTRPVKVPVGATPSNPPVSALALPVAVPLILASI
jgi:hypothetical protein